LAQLDAFNFFEVRGCHTARRYRIHHGACQNVELLDHFGRPEERLCFIPETDLVPGDVMLAQKIALEADELTALGVANRLMPPPLRPARQTRNFLP